MNRDEKNWEALPMLFRQNNDGEFVPCDGEVIWHINSRVSEAKKQAIKEFISKLPTKQDLIDACDNYSEELDTKIHFDDGWSQYRDEVIRLADIDTNS